MNKDVGMGCTSRRKIVETKEIPLAILSRILPHSCVTLCLAMLGGVMHDCVSVLDSIAKGFPCFYDFFAWCIPSLHPHSFFALVPHICVYISANTCMYALVLETW